MDRKTILAHALPPSARAARYHRDFTEPQQRELRRLGCDTERVNRLERILPAIAYYTEQGPSKADVQVQLDRLAKKAGSALDGLCELLDAPEHELARSEARMWLLQTIDMPEAQRLRDALADVQAAAKSAEKRVSKAPQTRAVAHAYPVLLIEAALNLDRDVAAPSESESSPFVEIVGICYDAAGAPNTTPIRAIRKFLKDFNASPEK